MRRKEQVTSILDLITYDLDDMLAQFPVTLRNHSRRVAICASVMAEYADEFLRFSYDMPTRMHLAPTVHLGGTCHDIGKIMLPLLLTEKEAYTRHPIIGAQLLEQKKGDIFDNDIQAQIALDMIRYHHERPDGAGFPTGLKAAKIPVPVGICTLADWLDHRLSLGHESWSDIDSVINEVASQTGTLFCESAVDCFNRAWPRLAAQYIKWDTRATPNTIFQPAI